MALPVPLASAHVSYVQWIVFGEHALPVRSAAAATARAATSVAIPSTFIAGSFLDSEILVQLVHVGVELRVDDGVDDAPMLHDVMPVGHGGREPEILLDEKDREALRLQAPDGGADLLDDHRGQALRRLVQQQT